MLDSIRKGQRWLTLLLVTFVGAVFVFFMGSGGDLGPGTPTGSAVVELGDFRLSRNDYQRLRSRQEESMREQLGDNFDARAIAPYLDAQTLSTLVDSVVLAQSAKDLGLLVSDSEIQKLVIDSPSFRNESGSFDLDAFKNYTAWEYGSEANFLANIRQDMLRQKMVSLLYDQATVSPAEARLAALYALEQVRIGYVQLSLETLPPGEVVDEEAVADYLEQNRDSIQVVYNDSINLYSQPERVHARHILVEVAQEADAETVSEAQTRIEAALERINSGEAFDEVAQQLSDDVGSRDRGGDIGTFARGDNLPEIDNAAFSLQAGEVSDIQRSDSGFHLVQVIERIPANTRPFEEVAPEIARTRASSKAAEARAQDLTESLLAEIEAGRSLEESARILDLVVERTPLLSRRPDGFIPGLGAAPEILTEAFQLDLASPTSTNVHSVGSQLVLVQLLEYVEPTQEELDQAIRAQEDSLLTSKRNGVVQQWVEQRRSEWEKSGKLLVDSASVISGS